MLQQQASEEFVKMADECDSWECCTNTPVEAVVCVVRQYERWHNQTTRHGAHLLTQPLYILTDSLIPAQQMDHTTHHHHHHHHLYLHCHWWLTGCPLPPWAHWQYNKLDHGNRRYGGSQSAFSSSSHTLDYRWTDPGFLTGKREKREKTNMRKRWWWRECSFMQQ